MALRLRKTEVKALTWNWTQGFRDGSTAESRQHRVSSSLLLSHAQLLVPGKPYTTWRGVSMQRQRPLLQTPDFIYGEKARLLSSLRSLSLHQESSLLRKASSSMAPWEDALSSVFPALTLDHIRLALCGQLNGNAIFYMSSRGHQLLSGTSTGKKLDGI